MQFVFVGERRSAPSMPSRATVNSTMLVGHLGDHLPGRDIERGVENARLKKLVANQALDIDMLREVAEGNF